MHNVHMIDTMLDHYRHRLQQARHYNERLFISQRIQYYRTMKSRLN